MQWFEDQEFLKAGKAKDFRTPWLFVEKPLPILHGYIIYDIDTKLTPEQLNNIMEKHYSIFLLKNKREKQLKLIEQLENEIVTIKLL